MSDLDEWIKSLKKIRMVPEMDSDSKEKGLEIKCIIDKKLNEKKTSLKKLEQKSGDKLEFGQYKFVPNSTGVFKLWNNWFFYAIDERGNKNIKGPFTYDGIIYVWALKMGVADLFEKYTFNSKEKNIFLQNNFNGFKELKEFFGKNE